MCFVGNKHFSLFSLSLSFFMKLLLLLITAIMLCIHQSQHQINLKSNEKSCQLLDGFGILIQFLLAFTALVTLICKRARETPQRPLQIW